MAVVARSGSVFGQGVVSNDNLSSAKFAKSLKGEFRGVAPARVVAAFCVGKYNPAEFRLVESTQQGIELGLEPVSIEDCSGGVYIFKDERHRLVSVFKPAQEEPHASSNPKGYQSSVEQMKSGVSAGEGAVREVAAYILDLNILGYSGIPATIMAEIVHPKFAHLQNGEGVIGSLQMYKENMGSSDDFGCSMFPVEEVHKIGILDIRIANLDRHAGNILVGKNARGAITLTPIDHAFSFPAWNNLVDITFEWLNWPQAREPFSEGTKEVIRKMNVSYDAHTLQKLALAASSIATLRIMTMFLKTGAEHLSLFHLGSAMVRGSESECSVMENLIQAASKQTGGATPDADSGGRFFKALQTIFDEWVNDQRKSL